MGAVAGGLTGSGPSWTVTQLPDVTENSGETRTNNIAINVGYTALKAELKASDWFERLAVRRAATALE